MSSQLIVNCRLMVNTRMQTHLLRGAELADLPCIEKGWLLTEDSEISSYGLMSDMPSFVQKLQGCHAPGPEGPVIDATGRFILPAWCDSHTHLVFAGSREEEFVDRIRGMSYGEINARGGGILNSAAKLAETSEDTLFNEAWKRLAELGRLGTGAVEIKSGYGLTVEGELKMLRVIKKLKERSSLSIRASFLGAHTFPPRSRRTTQAISILSLTICYP